MILKLPLRIVCCGLALAAAGATLAEVLPKPAPLPIDHAIRDKNFHLFRILEEKPGLALLQAEPTLTRLAREQRARIVAALDSCATDAACYVAAPRLSAAQIEIVATTLQQLCAARPVACGAVARRLRESGTFVRHQDAPDRELLVTAWRLSAAGVDRLFATYGEGVAPRYPAIDSMTHDPKSESFARLLRTATRVVLDSDAARNPFYGDNLRFALQLLALNGRDEAGRHEPLQRTENRLAAQQVRRIRWRDYRYSVILVPGQGPTEAGIRLAPEGRLRLELAVERYRQGLAPFLLVSGGYVHPARTPFSEAIEMKRSLMEDFGVPERAIFVDPHARHTTTNLRNAARLIYRHGLPFTMPGLLVSDELQAGYVMQDPFDERNRRETGVLPYRGKTRRSPVDVEFLPSIEALQTGFDDPLDP